MLDQTEMRAFQYREENGYLPDEVYVPSAEDDPDDPEHWEIVGLVLEGYQQTNEQRRTERDRRRISVLEETLRAHGIEVPE